MKFTADKNVLYEAVSGASKACGVKSALNILDGVFLNLQGDVLTITGYDLEICIKISIKVDGQEDGKAVTDPRLFSEMVKKSPEENVNFTLKNEKEIIIVSGKSKVSIPCKLGEDFPNIIESKKETSFNIKEKAFKEVLQKVDYATLKNDSNPVLMGVKIEILDNVLTAVATDGNRLAIKFQNNIGAENVEFIIPEKAVSSLLRSLSDDSEKEINIFIDKNQMRASKENYVIISRLLEGKFVNYQRIINNPFPRILTVNVKEFISSMERCMLLMSDKLKSPVNCSFNDQTMKISCVTSLGAIDEEISVIIKEGDFSDLKINFNPRFLLDALLKSNCEEVTLNFDGALNPVKITPPLKTEENKNEEENFIFLIVPIRSQ